MLESLQEVDPRFLGELRAWLEQHGFVQKPLPATNLFKSVKDYGAKGDGFSDDYTAIAAAVAAVAASGGTLYFPPGDYLMGTALSITSGSRVAILGAGRTSRIRPTFAAGDAITVNGPSFFEISNIAIVPTVSRNAGTYNVHVLNCAYPSARDVYMNNLRGGLWMFETCNFLAMSNCQGDSNDNTGGDTCLRLKASGGTITNCNFRVGPFSSGGYSSAKPCVHITGTTTSLEISNSCFTGGGPHSKFSISGITSTAGNFTVTTSVNHDFQAGDHVVIRGASVSAYNQAFRIASVTANTITVTSTLNPGVAAAQGTAESQSVNVLVSNEDGAVNESAFSNVLFSAGQPNLYGTVGLLFDGRRGPAGSARELSGWTVTGCYFDFGTVGIMLHGKALSVSNDPSVYGIAIAAAKCESTRSAVHLEGVQGITLTGLIGNSNQSPTADYLAVDNVGAARPFEVYIHAGVAAPYTQGITLTGCNLGMEADWSALHEARSKDNAIFLAGATNLQDITVVGCQLYGRQFPMNDDGIGSSLRLRMGKNTLSSGGIGANAIPSAVAANTMNINPYHDIQKVTGATNIQNISPGWAGKEIVLLFVSGLTLLSGGNLALGANYAIAAGQLVKLVHDGTSWYVK